MSRNQLRLPRQFAASTAALLLTSAAAATDQGTHCAASVGPTASAWIASAPPIATPSLLDIARRSAATLTPEMTGVVDAAGEETPVDGRAAIDDLATMADGGQLSAHELYQRVLKYQLGPATGDPAPALANRPNADPNCLAGPHASAG